MFAQERQRAIETIVRQGGRLTVSGDLRQIEATGKVVRALGGALHPEAQLRRAGVTAKVVSSP